MTEEKDWTPPDLAPEPGWVPAPARGVYRPERSFISGDPRADRIRVAYWSRPADGAYVGKVWFGPYAEGPPLSVHGGALAAVLDDLMGRGAWVAGHQVLAGTLGFTYRSRCPLGEVQHLESEIVEVAPRKVMTRARLFDPGGAVRTEATGTFVKITPEIFEAERARLVAAGAPVWRTGAPGQSPGVPPPCLVLFGGLPGAGKSALARRLARELGFRRVATDAVRRELAGLGPTEPTPDARRAEIYSREMNEATYAEVTRRVEAALGAGERVVMDATFTRADRREAGLALAEAAGVPGVFLVATASDETIRARLAGREGDESDADYAVHRKLAAAWQPDGARAAAARVDIDNDGDLDAAWGRVTAALHARCAGAGAAAGGDPA